MANKVKELIQDVADRLGVPNFSDQLPQPKILRKMNDIYHEINAELKCLQSEFVINSANRETGEDYWTLPDDFLEVYALDELDFVSPTLLNRQDTEYNYVYTIEKGRFLVPNAADDFGLTLHYYTSGKILVDDLDANITASTTNTPAWDSHYWWALVIGTCLRLFQDYPSYKADLIDFQTLKGRLGAKKYNSQSTTPNMPMNYEQASW